MRKTLSLFLVFFMMTMCVSCFAPVEIKPITMVPQASQMKAICELAVMDCYYHNVAKFIQEDAEGFLWWKKDKRFWIEYDGLVKLGIDISKVSFEVNDTLITVTLPSAKVLDCKVISTSLTEESYIIDMDSAKIEATDETAAFATAQTKLLETAENDTTLLASAQQRAQALLEDYVTNIGNAVGVEYSIKWVYVDTQ